MTAATTPGNWEIASCVTGMGRGERGGGEAEDSRYRLLVSKWGACVPSNCPACLCVLLAGPWVGVDRGHEEKERERKREREKKKKKIKKHIY